MNPNDICDVAGKNVVITGAARGIGFGIAHRLTTAGANCLLVDQDKAALKDAAAKLTLETGEVHIKQADVSSAEAAHDVAQAAVTALGTIDVLVNNAGIFPTAAVLDMTPEFFRHVIDVNLVGLVFLCKSIGQRMREQGTGGKVVNIASIDSVHPSMEGLAAYDASKGGVLMFTKNFALEMAKYGVQVNAIAPGGVATEGVAAPMSGLTPQQQSQVLAEFVAKVPLGRIGNPDDIAKVVQFLSSTGSDYMTGVLVPVDGGTLLS